MITVEQAVKELHAKHSGVNDRPEMWQDIARMMEALVKDNAADKPYDCYWSRRALAAEAAIEEALQRVRESMGLGVQGSAEGLPANQHQQNEDQQVAADDLRSPPAEPEKPADQPQQHQNPVAQSKAHDRL